MITLELDGVSVNERTDEPTLLNFIKNGYNADGSPKKTYTCTVNYNEEGRVDEIVFREEP